MSRTDVTRVPDFPERELAKQISSHVSQLDMACNHVVHPLADTRSRRISRERVREEITSLSDYAALISSILSSLYDVLEQIRQIVIATDDPGASLAAVSSKYKSLLSELDRVAEEGRSLLESLRTFKRHITRALYYPPIIHFLIIRLLGPPWNPRQAAIRTVPPVVRAIRAEVQSIMDLAAQLRLHVTDSQARFSVSKLVEIRTLGKQTREEVAFLAKQTAWEFYSLARNCRETAQYVRRLASVEFK